MTIEQDNNREHTQQAGANADTGFGQNGREGFGDDTGRSGQRQESGQPQQFEQSQRSPDFAGSGSDGQLVEQIREHMDVLDDDGEKLGRVDSVDGTRIKLTRADSGDGQHHYIAVSDVAGIENDQVMLHAGARAIPDNDGS